MQMSILMGNMHNLICRILSNYSYMLKEWHENMSTNFDGNLGFLVVSG